MFLENKYTKYYFNIINNAKQEERVKSSEYENHHILPKSLCPEFKNLKQNPWNGILLSGREHFIVHRLLVKMTTGIDKRAMAYGLHRMLSGISNNHSRYLPKSILYELIRKENKKLLKGRKHSSKDRKKISEALKGRKFTVEHKKNLSKVKKGKPQPDHVARMLRTIRKGMLNSEEHKKKCSKSLTGKKRTPEMKKQMSINHANVSGGENPNAKEWLIIDPDGNDCKINGTMTQFCKEHNLPASVMRTIGRTGKYPKRGKCVGWVVIQLS